MPTNAKRAAKLRTMLIDLFADEPKLLEIEQAAALLGCHKRTVRKLIDEGELLVLTTLDVTKRIPKTAIVDYLVGRTLDANANKPARNRPLDRDEVTA